MSKLVLQFGAIRVAQALLPVELRREYLQRCHRDKPKGVAKVAAARKLAVRLYWMLRTQKPYPEIVHVESSRGWPWTANASP